MKLQVNDSNLGVTHLILRAVGISKGLIVIVYRTCASKISWALHGCVGVNPQTGKISH